MRIVVEKFAVPLRELVVEFLDPSFLRFPPGDVADARRYEDPLGAVERAQHDLDGKLAAILPSRRKFYPGPDLLRQCFGWRSRAVCDEPFCEALGNDVLHFLPDQFIAAVPKLLLRLHIQ